MYFSIINHWLHEILYENWYIWLKISAISAITNIGVSAYRQKCHIGTSLNFQLRICVCFFSCFVIFCGCIQNVKFLDYKQTIYFMRPKTEQVFLPLWGEGTTCQKMLITKYKTYLDAKKGLLHLSPEWEGSAKKSKVGGMRQKKKTMKISILPLRISNEIALRNNSRSTIQGIHQLILAKEMTKVSEL